MYERSAYTQLPWFSPRPSPEVVRAVADRVWPRGGALLDIGCGAGSNLRFLAQRGFEAHGIDLSPVAVAAAQERAARAGVAIDARVGDALALAFPRGRFDGAIDIGCFHTLPIPRRAQYREELYRVLRPGATLVLLWAARESRRPLGPPHRPSLEELATALEARFLFEATRFVRATRPGGLEVYVGRLRRRDRPRPPVR
jgi:SAM-dependent methyltransferase